MKSANEVLAKRAATGWEDLLPPPMYNEYADKVFYAIMHILQDERRISEKDFARQDELRTEVQQWFTAPETIDICAKFEANNNRPQMCAEAFIAAWSSNHGLVITAGRKSANEVLASRVTASITVYHGTHAQFNDFKVEGFGAHFGTEEQARARLHDTAGTAGRLLTVQLDIEHPYEVVSDLGDWEDMEMLREYFAEANEGPFTNAEFDKFKTPADVRRGLMKKGYDGVSYMNNFEGTDSNAWSYIAFKPEQIHVVSEKKAATTDRINKFWITPAGEVVNVEGGEEHIVEALRRGWVDLPDDLQLAQELAEDQGDEFDYTTIDWAGGYAEYMEELWGELLTKGYIRGGRTSMESYFMLNNSAPSAAKDQMTTIARDYVSQGIPVQIETDDADYRVNNKMELGQFLRDSNAVMATKSANEVLASVPPGDGWITPDGEFHHVVEAGHVAFVIEYAYNSTNSELKDLYNSGKIDSLNGQEIYELMHDEGGVRISGRRSGETTYVSLTKLNSATASTLISILQDDFKTGAEIMVEFERYLNYTTVPSDDRPAFGELLRKLREMAGVMGSLRTAGTTVLPGVADGVKYWITPDYQVYKLGGDDHESVALQYFGLDSEIKDWNNTNATELAVARGYTRIWLTNKGLAVIEGQPGNLPYDVIDGLLVDNLPRVRNIMLSGGTQISAEEYADADYSLEKAEAAVRRHNVLAPVAASKQTESPAFKAWFGNSLVVDDAGNPKVVYRGQYGAANDIQSRLPSITFAGDPDVANTYATEPNDSGDTVENSQVLSCYLSIQNPVINNPDDPFVEFADLISKLGAETVATFAKKHEDFIISTNNWDENFSADYDGVGALLDAKPDALKELYMDTYPLLDDPEFVDAAKAAGYDGAIHVGNGASMDDIEYRVFSREQIRPVGDKGTTAGRRTANQVLASRLLSSVESGDGWISPTGEFHDVPVQGHELFALKVLRKLQAFAERFQSGELDEATGDDVYSLMYAEGWVRVTGRIAGKTVDVSFRRVNQQTATTVIAVLTSEFKAGSAINVELGHREYIDVRAEDKPAFTNLLRAVRKAGGLYTEGGVRRTASAQETIMLPWGRYGEQLPLFKNPGEAELEYLRERYKDEVGTRSAGDDTPKIITTYDEQGNEYAWMSLDAIHEPVERWLETNRGVKSNQDRDWVANAEQYKARRTANQVLAHKEQPSGDKMQLLHDKAKQYASAPEFIRAFYTEDWSDQIAFGYVNGIQPVDPKLLKIKWQDDWANAEPYDVPVEDLPPIEVAYENNKLYVEDGHHRLKMALKQKVKTIMMDLTIKQSPFTALPVDGDAGLKKVWEEANSVTVARRSANEVLAARITIDFDTQGMWITPDGDVELVLDENDEPTDHETWAKNNISGYDYATAQMSALPYALTMGYIRVMDTDTVRVFQYVKPAPAAVNQMLELAREALAEGKDVSLGGGTDGRDYRDVRSKVELGRIIRELGLKTSAKKSVNQVLAAASSAARAIAEADARYPRAGTTCSGLQMLDDVTNTSSISAAFTAYEELPGVREIPISEFDADPKDLYYAADAARDTMVSYVRSMVDNGVGAYIGYSRDGRGLDKEIDTKADIGAFLRDVNPQAVVATKTAGSVSKIWITPEGQVVPCEGAEHIDTAVAQHWVTPPREGVTSWFDEDMSWATSALDELIESGYCKGGLIGSALGSSAYMVCSPAAPEAAKTTMVDYIKTWLNQGAEVAVRVAGDREWYLKNKMDLGSFLRSLAGEYIDVAAAKRGANDVLAARQQVTTKGNKVVLKVKPNKYISTKGKSVRKLSTYQEEIAGLNAEDPKDRSMSTRLVDELEASAPIKLSAYARPVVSAARPRTNFDPLSPVEVTGSAIKGFARK